MTTGMIAICPGASVFRAAIGACGTGLTTYLLERSVSRRVPVSPPPSTGAAAAAATAAAVAATAADAAADAAGALVSRSQHRTARCKAPDVRHFLPEPARRISQRSSVSRRRPLCPIIWPIHSRE